MTFLLSTEANTNFPTANSKARVPHWSHHRDEIPAVFFARGQTSSSCHQVGISQAQSHGVRREDLGSRTPGEQGRKTWELVAVVTWGRDSSQLLWNGRKLDLRSSCEVSFEAARGLFVFCFFDWQIDHFRIYFSLYFKASLIAKSLSQISVFMHIEVRISTIKNVELWIALKKFWNGLLHVWLHLLLTACLISYPDFLQGLGRALPGSGLYSSDGGRRRCCDGRLFAQRRRQSDQSSSREVFWSTTEACLWEIQVKDPIAVGSRAQTAVESTCQVRIVASCGEEPQRIHGMFWRSTFKFNWYVCFDVDILLVAWGPVPRKSRNVSGAFRVS